MPYPDGYSPNPSIHPTAGQLRAERLIDLAERVTEAAARIDSAVSHLQYEHDVIDREESDEGIVAAVEALAADLEAAIARYRAKPAALFPYKPPTAPEWNLTIEQALQEGGAL